MAWLLIKTREGFLDALKAVPFAATRLPTRLAHDEQLAEYMLWRALLDLVHEAMNESNWAAVGALLALYDAVERAGRRGEMFETSWVAFLEDVRIPTDPARLRQFWLHSPPAFTTAIKADRGLR